MAKKFRVFDHLVGTTERNSEEAVLLELDFLNTRRSTLKNLKMDVTEIDAEISAVKEELK